jgi:hypothetical protein
MLKKRYDGLTSNATTSNGEILVLADTWSRSNVTDCEGCYQKTNIDFQAAKHSEAVLLSLQIAITEVPVALR